jgi:hypothetical protein
MEKPLLDTLPVILDDSDPFWTDTVYQILNVSQRPIKVVVIKFMGDPKVEMAYQKITDPIGVLDNSYLLLGGFGVGDSPESFGGVCFSRILGGDEGAEHYKVLSKVWDYFRDRLVPLAPFDFVGARDLVRSKKNSGDSVRINRPKLMDDEDITFYYKFPHNRFIKEGSTTRYFGVKSGEPAITWGAWKFAPHALAKFKSAFTRHYPSISVSFLNRLKFKIVEQECLGSIYCYVQGKKGPDDYHAEFLSDDDPWRVIICAILSMHQVKVQKTKPKEVGVNHVYVDTMDYSTDS